jgi:hypothetical protein
MVYDGIPFPSDPVVVNRAGSITDERNGHGASSQCASCLVTEGCHCFAKVVVMLLLANDGFEVLVKEVPDVRQPIISLVAVPIAS